MGKFENAQNQSYETMPFYDLKEKLADGEYIYLSIEKKDSAKRNLKDYTAIKGQYKNRLRQGRFEYYQRYKVKKKWENKLMKVYTYKDGILDGYYMSGNSAYKTEEGYYQQGKRHGFFITYDFYGGGSIQKIELYLSDKLQYYIDYTNGNMNSIKSGSQ